MATIKKIRCNGPGKHVNTVDLERAARKDVIVKSANATPSTGGYPEQVVLKCRECAYQVIITREMFEKYLGE